MYMTEVTRNKKIKKAISERIEKEKHNLKELILKTAGELFLEKGYEKFSLRQVAERIGYSATTIYLYFKDKDDLLFSIVLQGFDIFNNKLTEAEKSSDETIKKLNRVGRAYINFGIEYPVYYQIMFMQRTDFLFKSRPGDYDEKPMINSFSVLTNLVTKAIEEKKFIYKENCQEIYTNLLWTNVHGVVSLHIVMPEVFTVEKLKVVSIEGLELLIKGFLAK